MLSTHLLLVICVHPLIALPSGSTGQDEILGLLTNFDGADKPLLDARLEQFKRTLTVKAPTFSEFDDYLEKTIMRKINKLLERNDLTSDETNFLNSFKNLVTTFLTTRDDGYDEGDKTSQTALDIAENLLTEYNANHEAESFRLCDWEVKRVKLYSVHTATGLQYVEYIARGAEGTGCKKIQCNGEVDGASILTNSCNDYSYSAGDSIEGRSMGSSDSDLASSPCIDGCMDIEAEDAFEACVIECESNNGDATADKDAGIQLKSGCPVDNDGNALEDPVTGECLDPVQPFTVSAVAASIALIEQYKTDRAQDGSLSEKAKDNFQDCVYKAGAIVTHELAGSAHKIEVNARSPYQECFSFQCTGSVSGSTASGISCNDISINEELGLWGVAGSEATGAHNMDENSRKVVENLLKGYRQSQYAADPSTSDPVNVNDNAFVACDYTVRHRWNGNMVGDELSIQMRVKGKVSIHGDCSPLLCSGQGTANTITNMSCDWEFGPNADITLVAFNPAVYDPEATSLSS